MPNPLKRQRGRPLKFGRESAAITLTLPTDVLDRLGSMDTDLGRAIVAMVARQPAKRRPRPPAELATYGNRSVILVTPVRAFSRLRGVQLVPVSDGRALIALQHPHGIAQLELDLRDVLDDRSIKGRDRAVFEAVAEVLRDARLSHALNVVERSIIVLEPKKRGERQRP